MALLEEKIYAVMGLNNCVANLVGRYENAKSKALQWETVVGRIKSHAALKTEAIHEVSNYFILSPTFQIYFPTIPLVNASLCTCGVN